MNTDAATIVIPCHNHGAFLGEAIASALAQDVADTRVIVADDGSTDSARAVAAAYAPRVELLAFPHRGLVPTLNEAVTHVSSRFLLRLDADDVLPPGYLRALLDGLAAERDPRVAYAYCDARLFGARTGRQRARRFSGTILRVHNFIHCAALVDWRRVQHLGYLDPRMTDGLEDWDYWLRLLAGGFRGTYVSTTELGYRQHIRSSRNALDPTRHRRMWDQLHANHPTLFRSPHGRLALLAWRAACRLGIQP